MEVLNTLLPLVIMSFKTGQYWPITTFKGIWHEKQETALKLLMDQETRFLAFGGAAGPGKSWLGCAWLFFLCLSFPGIRCFIGREELKRLRESTLQTFFKVATRYGAKNGMHYRYNGQDHYILFTNGSRIDLLDLKYLPSDPLYERYGSIEYTCGWIEEGGEIHSGAYDTLKSRIGRQYNREYNLLGKILITLNPKKNWVYSEFYKPYKDGTLPPEKKFLPALVQDNPFIDPQYIYNLHAITDKVRKQRLLYGNFEYDDDDNKLMDYDIIQNIFTSSYIPGGEKYITADIARFGKDTTTVMLWNGWRVEYIFILKQKKTTETAKFIDNLRLQHKVKLSNIVVDSDGVGGGVTDILACKEFLNNAAPMHNPKTKQPQNYKNLKTQCYYILSEIINDNGLYINTDDLELREKITGELEQVKKFNPDTDGKLQIVPKEQVIQLIGRSPDLSDCIMMRVFFELQPVKSYHVITV